MADLSARTWNTLQRYPALQRALRFGVRAEVNGMVVQVFPHLVGDQVVTPVVVAGTAQTRFGAISAHGRVDVAMDVATFGAMLQEAESRGMLPRLSELVEALSGSRAPLNLPR